MTTQRTRRRHDARRRRAGEGDRELHRGGILPATKELLIDAEEDKYLRAVLVGLLREGAE